VKHLRTVSVEEELRAHSGRPSIELRLGNSPTFWRALGVGLLSMWLSCTRCSMAPEPKELLNCIRVVRTTSLLVEFLLRLALLLAGLDA